MSTMTASERKPREHIARTTCKCHQCGNRINKHETAAIANHKIVCSGCAEQAVWNVAYQKWEFK